MPADIQNHIKNILLNCENTFAYLDDILIVAKSSKDTHKQLIDKQLKN